ncbi:MAG: ShlB/FhaC/HecB family hemolysin secretion/activation protein [Verrucomicrobiota bacterium]
MTGQLQPLTFVAVFSLCLPTFLSAQDVVVDQYGTEYATDLMPASFTKVKRKDLGAAGATATSSRTSSAPLINRSRGGEYIGPQRAQISDDVLVDNLTGVVLVPTPGDVVVSGVPGVTGIWHDLEEFPTRAGNAITSYLGQPVSLASLDSMVKEVIRAYRDSDRPVVDVLLPEQDITSGVVQLVVVEGRLDNIRVVGAKNIKEEEYLKSLVRTNEGEVIRSSEVLGDLSFMNKNPYRRVDLVYAPGYRFATTDIVLKTNEVDVFTAFAGYDNSGNRLLGRDRLLFGATWAEAFGRPDSTLAYQLSTDIDFDSIESHSLVYTLPFRWRHYFTLMGAYVDTEATVPVGGSPLDISGTNWQLSPRYTIPIRSSRPNVTHEVAIGYDYKSSNNDLEFGGANFFDVTTEIHQFSIGYDRIQQWDNGTTNLNLTGYVSPGGSSNHNEDEVFTQSREGAEASYSYITASMEHTQRLPRSLLARLRLQGQMASEKLLSSEQLGIGGPLTVRGYETSVARGDEGILASAEIYSPAFSLSDRYGWRFCSDEVRFLLFADFASVSDEEPILAGDPESQDLFSLGAGMRWTFNDWLRIRLDAGLPVSFDLPDAEADEVRDIYWHLGATATF